MAGNCGYSIAPLAPEHTDFLQQLLARVEGMSLESLRQGLVWDWQTFGEYLDRLDGTLSVNAGFLVGHSAVRRVVMGDSASSSVATGEQIQAMVAQVHQALAAGSMGFSSSRSSGHHDGNGRPVPSRLATDDEMLALAAAVRQHPGTTLEFIPDIGQGFFDEADMSLMANMSLAADRPLNWNVMVVDAARRQWTDNWLSASDYAAARGAKVVALTPGDVLQARISFASGVPMDGIPGWTETMTLPLPRRIAALRDPETRRHLRARREALATGSLNRLLTWERIRVGETFSPENQGLEGRLIGDIAAERGGDPFDTLLDLVLADDLRTGLLPPPAGADDASWQERAEIWRDPRAVIGASDAGAHVDMISAFSYCTAILGESVRERGLLGVEEAVRLLTDVPARLYGLRGRGRVAEEWCADLVVFDAGRIGQGSLHLRDDLPAGGQRLFRQPEGVAHVLVNGTEIVRDGATTDARPGRLLRSGRDTDTVDLATCV